MWRSAITRAGGVDLQILGIGSNGHLAFNEPSSSLTSRTRVETLMPGTRQDNAGFFGNRVEDVPRSCLRQGLGTILDAREIVLIASGSAKARAVAGMVEGEITSLCPASVLHEAPEASGRASARRG
jgi:glucosamine-6-phosphate deaminase